MTDDTVQRQSQKFTTNQTILVLLLVTLFVPTMVFWPGGPGGDTSGDFWIANACILAVTWMILPSHWEGYQGAFGINGGGFYFLEPTVIILSMIFIIFNFLFAIQVYRFCKGGTSKRGALIPGVIGMILPLFVTWQPFFMFVLERTVGTKLFLYAIPIPIQFLVGIILMKYGGPWDGIRLWEEEMKNDMRD